MGATALHTVLLNPENTADVIVEIIEFLLENAEFGELEDIPLHVN